MSSTGTSVTLPYPPSANRYWRHVNSRVLLSAAAREYRDTAALLAFAQGMRPLHSNVAVSLALYRPRRSGDLDNRLKVLLDALRGVAYTDDDQVVELLATRHDDASNPRVVVTVMQASEQ